MDNYIVIFEERVMVTAFAILAMFYRQIGRGDVVLFRDVGKYEENDSF